jgi:hypothetical protein
MQISLHACIGLINEDASDFVIIDNKSGEEFVALQMFWGIFSPTSNEEKEFVIEAKYGGVCL